MPDSLAGPARPLEPVTALILCGGRGRRAGFADKGLSSWRGRPLVEHVIERVAPQVAQLALSANRNLARYRRYGAPTAADRRADFRGPLAGIAACLPLCRMPWLLVCPCDSPALPADLARRLGGALAAGAGVAVAHDGARRQRAVFMMRRELGAALVAFHADGRRRALGDWLDSTSAVDVDFSDAAGAFLNVNAIAPSGPTPPRGVSAAHAARAPGTSARRAGSSGTSPGRSR